MEIQGVDMMTGLQKVAQSTLNGLPPGAPAGVWTTRAAAEAFFIAGTNRAQFRFTMLNHMCNDMEQVHDVKLPPDRIRQDVSRSPGGDSRLYLNNCIGCHNGMDPMAGAFAYYNFDEQSGIEYTPGVVQPKYFNNNANFEFGYVTTDDSWANYWRTHGQTTGAKVKTSSSAGIRTDPPAASVPHRWVRNSPTAMPLRSARSRKFSGRSA
jgi:hypothetical protein